MDVAGGKTEPLLEAYVVFMRRTSIKVQLELRTDEAPEFLTISIGGPPPKSFFVGWMQLRKAHFPEYASGVTIYPLDPEGARAKKIVSMLETAFAHEVECHTMVMTEAGLMKQLNVPEGLIPDFVLKCEETPELTQKVSRDRAELNLLAAQQEVTSLATKGTFIQGWSPELGSLRRSNSAGPERTPKSGPSADFGI